MVQLQQELGLGRGGGQPYDEDDEMAVIEQDVQRLVIVTQVLLFII